MSKEMHVSFTGKFKDLVHTLEAKKSEDKAHIEDRKKNIKFTYLLELDDYSIAYDLSIN